jgi:hypothetical protein
LSLGYFSRKIGNILGRIKGVAASEDVHYG